MARQYVKQAGPNARLIKPNAGQIAQQLYQEAITEAGHPPPGGYADLLEIVLASSALVVWCADAPLEFTGIQIGDILYVNAAAELTDHQRLRILAHEWCHWLRRRVGDPPRAVRLYQGGDVAASRDGEERIAGAFECLF